jgi:purine nucleosidase
MDPRRILVDSDNALGSARGDVDDGIALATLLRSPLEIEAIASVFGNTSAAAAERNTRALATCCSFAGPCIQGAASPRAPTSDAARHLAERSRATTLLALGPLTNVAQALGLAGELDSRIAELVCLGSNARSLGRWPPLWPFEYNFTKDAGALVRVFGSAAPITVVPLDQARRLRLRFADLAAIEGELGAYLRANARRWFDRARWLKLQSTVPVWDLVAAMYVIEPGRFATEPRQARAHPSGWVEYGAKGRSVRVVADFDPEEVWRAALALLNAK